MLLKDLMKSKNYTQLKLANLIGKSQRLVSSWVNGVCSPNPSDILKLASILNVTEKEILECFAKDIPDEQ